MNESQELWLKTPDAARALGCSERTLRRARDTHGGPLRAGVHYCRGLSVNSAIIWNIELCRQTINRHGVMAYRDFRAELLLRRLQRDAA